jgi:two-component system, OmpR family, sensor kinase ParS
MIRLFLKLYGLLIATLVFSFVVQMQLMDWVYKEMASGFDFRQRFMATFHLLEESLSTLPQDQWPARFQELSRGFSTPARIGRLASLPERQGLWAEQVQRLDAGAIVTVDRPEGGFILVKRLRGSDYGAVLEFPGPDNKRIRIATYVVNWLTEFLIVAVLVFFWVRPFWRDLLKLRAGAEAVGSGEFDRRVEVWRGSALRSLAEGFNAMTEKIAVLMQSHRGLTSSVSHELRTPLARLKFSHSLAREEPRPEGKDRYLALMERDISELDELTTELLDYARLERGVPEIKVQSVPAEPWLEDLIADARQTALAAQRSASIAPKVDLETVHCEPRYMARAVINLIRNALQYARSTVTVSLGREGGRTVIHVDDDGTGIPASDRERVFEPFARLDESRDRDSGGFGLGLAIVRQVARWHGGDASISDSPLGGTRVTIAW